MVIEGNRVDIFERKVKEKENWLICLIVGVLLLGIVLLLFFGFKLRGEVLYWTIGGIGGFYIVVLSFLLESKIIKEIIETITETTEKFIKVPIIRTVEKPVIKEVERTIFIEPVRKKEFNYIASTQTRTYHRSSCKFAGLIKDKYKLVDDEEIYFKRLKYKSCKSCINKK